MHLIQRGRGVYGKLRHARTNILGSPRNLMWVEYLEKRDKWDSWDLDEGRIPSPSEAGYPFLSVKSWQLDWTNRRFSAILGSLEFRQVTGIRSVMEKKTRRKGNRNRELGVEELERKTKHRETDTGDQT